MSVLLLFILQVLAWVLELKGLVWGQAITSQVLLDSILLQQQVEVLDKGDQALQYWKNATLMMANLNTALSLTVNATALLFDPANATIFVQQMSVDECVVASPARNIANATLVQYFFCCHLRKLLAPALVGTLQAAWQQLQGSPGPGDNTQLAMALQSMQSMQYLDVVGYSVSPCLDTPTLLAAEQATVRAIGALTVGTSILTTYEGLLQTARALSACIDYPLAATGCASNVPLTLATAGPRLQFNQFDSSYQQVCSPAVINDIRLKIGCTAVPAQGG
jgi:hypothetical protein